MENKNTLLKVLSILLVIFGIILIISSVVAIGGVALVAALVGASAGALVLAAVLGLVGAIVELLAGIFGLKTVKAPTLKNVKMCTILGIIMIVLNLIGLIMNIASAGFSGSLVLSIILGIVFPIIYILAAKKGQQA